MNKFQMCDLVEVVNGNINFIGMVGKVLLTMESEGRYMIGFNDDRFIFANAKDLKILKKYYEQ